MVSKFATLEDARKQYNQAFPTKKEVTLVSHEITVVVHNPNYWTYSGLGDGLCEVISCNKDRDIYSIQIGSSDSDLPWGDQHAGISISNADVIKAINDWISKVRELRFGYLDEPRSHYFFSIGSFGIRVSAGDRNFILLSAHDERLQISRSVLDWIETSIARLGEDRNALRSWLVPRENLDGLNALLAELVNKLNPETDT